LFTMLDHQHQGEMPYTSLIVKIGGVVFAIIVPYLIFSSFTSPIQDIPGPWLAKFTDLWRLMDFYSGTQIETQRRLHEKFGSAVRIGPNMVSLNDPALFKTVYSTRGQYLKTDFYKVNDAMQNGNRIQNVFSTRDKALHAKYMRPIHKLFSLHHILSQEHLFSRTLMQLCQHLEERFIDGENTGLTCDLAQWIEFYCWDVDGEVTFGQPMGFLKAGGDETGMIHASELSQRYFGIVGQMPWLDVWLGKNARCPIKFPTFARTAEYCAQRVAERQASSDKGPPIDFLDHYIEAKGLNPETVTENEIIGYLMINILAGADTTAIVTKAIVIWDLLLSTTNTLRLWIGFVSDRLQRRSSLAGTRDSTSTGIHRVVARLIPH
ncbi:hypothetical protein JX266_014437, partial [Neoarthrinium moseri]